MKDKNNNIITQIRIQLASPVNRYDDFVKYVEDKTILDYRLVHDSKIYNYNYVVLYNNNMYRFGNQR